MNDDKALDMKLPCEIKIGHIKFSKGVSLRTFVNAAERWHALANTTYPPSERVPLSDYNISDELKKTIERVYEAESKLFRKLD